MKSEGKILVLDSDVLARQRLLLRLGTMGLKVLAVGKLDEARQCILHERPDLIITEWEMEGVRGAGVSQELKFHPSKICIFTSIELECLGPDSKRLGWSGVFHKNDRYELLEHLEKVLSGEKRNMPHSVESGSLEILLVDDSSAIRMGVKLALGVEFPGATIREAEDGLKALHEMSHKKVDLIITDLEMPGMDGREFLSRIHANGLLRRKPILVFSSNITPELRGVYGEQTNIHFLHKPCEAPKIAEAARRLISDTLMMRS